jgi:hypothetical protein
MTITRKEYMTQNYIKLIQELQETGIFKNDVLPSLDDDMDIADICYLFNMIFPSHSNYEDGINQLLDSKGIKLNKKEEIQVYGIIKPFLVLFKKYM